MSGEMAQQVKTIAAKAENRVCPQNPCKGGQRADATGWPQGYPLTSIYLAQHTPPFPRTYT